MIALDTDVLVIYHIFHNDPRYEKTKKLFDKLSNETKFVTIFNLLELCGILATATKIEDSSTVFHKYLTAKDIEILFPKFLVQSENDFWATLVSECFSRIQKGLRLGDATILWTLETNEDIDSMITWNTKHFEGKTSIKVLTPSEFSNLYS
jgi:predicted nucleic acid-binding protein